MTSFETEQGIEVESSSNVEGYEDNVAQQVEEAMSPAERNRLFCVLIILGIAWIIGLIAYSVLLEIDKTSADNSRPEGENVVLKAALPSMRGFDSRFVFFSTFGDGHVEPVSNCDVDEERGVIQIIDNTQKACVRLVGDSQSVDARAIADGGIALCTSDSVEIPASLKDERYEFQFVDTTPKPELKACRDTGYDWTSEYADYITGIPGNGLYAWCGWDWYMSHSTTEYGRCIAGLEVGDQVTVDGKTVIIEGISRAQIGSRADGVYAEIGWEKTLFSTCCDDGTNDVWVVYGE